MNRLFLNKFLVGLAAVTTLVSARANDEERDARPARNDARGYDSIANPRSSIGDEVDQQQWYNPADWWDRNPAYNYFTDEFYNSRSGQVGYRDYRSQAWNYPGSAWDNDQYWQDDWNENAPMEDWDEDFDWNDDEWWD